MAKRKKDLRAPEKVAGAKGRSGPLAAMAGSVGKGEGGGGRGGRGRGRGRGRGGRGGEGEGGNVFERLWSRRKFEVLGKKVKGEQKRIGKARSDAVEKRRSTLLEEFKQRNSANAFLDRRFGEKDDNLMEDEKAILRFQRERQAQLSRKSKFTLRDDDEEGGEGEDEVLTHGGAALSSLDDFHEEIGFEDEGDDQELDAEIVRNLHFGGPALDSDKRTNGSTEGEAEDERPKTKKEAMDELIAKSKYYKAEKQKEKEEDEVLREKLDQDFRQLSESAALISLMRPKKTNLLAALSGKAEKKDEKGLAANKKLPSGIEEEKDDYEKLAKEMVFDMRARATDRLKTPEEAAKAERERLLEMEKQRKRRMTGEASSDEEGEGEGEGEEGGSGRRGRKRVKRQEPSGDDLGENFVVEEEYEEKGWVYDVLARRGEEGEGEEGAEGESEGEEGEEDSEGEEESEEEEGSEGEEEGEGGSEGEESGEGEGGDLRAIHLEQADWEQSDDERVEATKVGEREGEKIGGGGDTGNGRKVIVAKGEKDERGRTREEPKEREERKEREEKKDRAEREERRDREEREKAAKELPYVIETPQTLAEFKAIVDGRETAELAEAIRRIRTCNAIHLAAENRRKMQIFYDVLIQYFAAVAAEKSLPLDRLDVLSQPLIEMSSATPLFAAVCARERISRMHKQLAAKLRATELVSVWPSVRTLLLLRLWAIIFPPSDFRHPVITPVYLLMGEYFSRCPVRSLRDAAIGCFLCAQILSMLSQNRRFCPEAICFLHALLRTALPEEEKLKKVQGLPYVMEEQVGGRPWLRLLQEGEGTKKLEPLNFITIMGSDEGDVTTETDTVRLGLLTSLLSTLNGFAAIHKNLSPFPEIFSPFLKTLEGLAKVSLPDELETLRERVSGSIKKQIEETENLRQPLRLQAKRAEPIKLFNPRFEEDFVAGRNYDPDRERAERKKLQRLVKKEARGAARELRKDNFFLAEEKRKEQEAAAEEKDEKYRKAMAFLQQQEAAYRSGQLGGKKKGRKGR